MTIGSVILVVDALDRLLVLKRHPESVWMPDKWGLPGGVIEEGELPAAAAIRETFEETTLEIGEISLVETTDTAYIFYSRDYMGTVKLDHEHTAWEWVRPEAIQTYDLVPGVAELFASVVGVY